MLDEEKKKEKERKKQVSGFIPINCAVRKGTYYVILRRLDSDLDAGSRRPACVEIYCSTCVIAPPHSGKYGYNN